MVKTVCVTGFCCADSAFYSLCLYNSDPSKLVINAQAYRGMSC
uniref:Uncharacterized protein n=1 Tax=Arundo donax TaxID=35708 RepID=A0A0A9DJX8_ARUDO